MLNTKVDNLQLKVFNSSQEMGKASAEFVADRLNKLIGSRGSVNLVLATGASQFTFIEALKPMALDWSRITVFHLDEYTRWGLNHSRP